jgi:hypothetical protein
LNLHKKCKTNLLFIDESLKNGYHKDQKMKINFFSNSNCGKNLFINVVKSIAHDYSINEIRSIDDINSNYINSRIIGKEIYIYCDC